MQNKRKFVVNFYIIIASILAVACLVFYFFPFFIFKSNDGLAECRYSGFDLTRSMFVSEDNLDDTSDDFIENTIMIELKEESKSSGFIWLAMGTITAGMFFMFLSLIFTLFKKGKILEIVCSLISLITFVVSVVGIRMLTSTMNEVLDNVLVLGTYSVDYALYITIVLNILFVITNFIRQDRSKKVTD